MFGDSIIWYLFLGGGGAGAAAVLAACDLLFAHRSRLGRSDRLAWTDELSRPLFARGYLAATVALVLGALCLLFELGRPERFLYVLALPTASVLTFGSYVLAATIVCAAALGGIALFGSARTPVALVRTLEWAALALGLATTAYTGVLLAQIGFVPLWGSPFLPALFTCSSLSVGVACAMAAALPDARRAPRLLRALARADSVVIAVEALVLTSGLGRIRIGAGRGGGSVPVRPGHVVLLDWVRRVRARAPARPRFLLHWMRSRRAGCRRRALGAGRRLLPAVLHRQRALDVARDGRLGDGSRRCEER